MEPDVQASANPAFEVDRHAIGWITLDDPDRKLNVLTEEVMRRLARIVASAREAAEAGRVRALVVISGKADSFLAGADVEAITALEDPLDAERKIRVGQGIFQEIERLPVPTIAAIHGVCVGGGVELALACRYRVLSDARATRMGLPEVMLGILPAWGGTTRLPRLVGLQASLELLLTGRQVDARRAHRIGLATRVLPAGGFRERVAAFARSVIEAPPGGDAPRRRMATRLLESNFVGRRVILSSARKRVLAQTGGHYPAPLRILDILRDHAGDAMDASLDAEAKAASGLVVGTVSKNLIHVFHMREAARKSTGVPGGGVDPQPVRAMGIIGAGIMGGGIAQLAASREIQVRMRDVRSDAITGGLKHARDLFDRAVRRRRLTTGEASRNMDRISGGLDWAGFRACDVVVEAVVEKLDVKRAVLREAEEQLREDCVLATNTSSLSVDAMADRLARPDRFCGMHFFNPVHRMPLVEVVRGSATSDPTVGTVYALALKLGKVPVVVRDGPGFLVNRILAPYLNEAGWLLSEGVTVQEIDDAARSFGMPMGPLRLVDEVGIDVSNHAGRSLAQALGGRLDPAPALVALGQSGRLGRKGGRGFYRYDGRRGERVDASVYGDLGASVPSRHRSGTDPEGIRRRLVIPMINEAARVLADGIVGSAAELDLAMIMGTGFPPFRGGLLRFADALHPRGVLDRTTALRDAHGARFAPAPLLEELARDNYTFYEAFRG